LHCRIQISAQKTFHCNCIIIVDSLLLSVSGTCSTCTGSTSAWAVASVIEAVVLAVRVAVVVVVMVEAVVVVVVMSVVTAVLMVVVMVDVAAVVMVAAVVAFAAGTTAAASSSVTFLCNFCVGDGDSGGITVVFRSIIRNRHGASECNEGKEPNYKKLGHD